MNPPRCTRGRKLLARVVSRHRPPGRSRTPEDWPKALAVPTSGACRPLWWDKLSTLKDPDEEEGGYTVTVPALPGCVTQGETLEEAVAMARDAIRGYIEALEKEGPADSRGTRTPTIADDQRAGIIAAG